MKFIFKTRIKYCTKETFKILKIVTISLLIIIFIILLKYKPLYKVEISETEIGYLKNKNELNSIINQITENRENEQVAFVTIESKPKLELLLVENSVNTNEDEIISAIKQNTKTTYTAYGITVNDDIKTYVKNEQDAQDAINTIKEKYKEENLDLNVGVKQIYSEDNISISEKSNAIEKIAEVADTQINKTKKEEQNKEEEKAIAVINEVAVMVKPVSGSITSRYAEESRIRSSAHTGLDIAAPSGTKIKVCSSGEVIFASNKGSYGNLIKVKHKNGVETWYAHCSKIYAKVGQKVNAGDVIGAVGTTGNSTGSHLHFEIRINGKSVNPQKYIYN